ncbi:MAG: hypothetical protein ABI432_02100 [Flavobacteriales bacterium]
MEQNNRALLQGIKEEHLTLLKAIGQREQSPPVVVSNPGGGWRWSWILLVVGVVIAAGWVALWNRGGASTRWWNSPFTTTLITALATIIVAFVETCGKKEGGKANEPSVSVVNNYCCPSDTVGDININSDILALQIKLEASKLELKQYIDVHCPCPPVKPPVKRKCVKNSCDVVHEIELMQLRLDSLCSIKAKRE